MFIIVFDEDDDPVASNFDRVEDFFQVAHSCDDWEQHNHHRRIMKQILKFLAPHEAVFSELRGGTSVFR